MEQKNKEFRLQSIQYRNNTAHHQHTGNRKRRFKHNNGHLNEQPPSKRARYNNSYSNHGQNNYVRDRKQKNTSIKKKEMEQDFHRITQRMRQIDIGKATVEYKNYISIIAKDKREPHHPQTPNPKHKMPNKWWKKAVNRWRKALHAFDNIDGPNSNINAPQIQIQKSPEKGKENMDTKLQNFCCEKCCQEFPKFDQWQKHREICEGKGINEEEADDDDFDLFNIDEDIDLNFMESKNNKTEEVEECSLLMSLNNVLDDDDDDDGLL